VEHVPLVQFLDSLCVEALFDRHAAILPPPR
jgi:hypothetical protein